jgi:hypothetical protein
VKWPLPASGLRNGQTEGGVICPLAIELTAGWSTTLMTECDLISSGVGGYEADFVNSITFSHDISGKLAGYVEFFSVVSSASNSKWQGQGDLGFTTASTTAFSWTWAVISASPDRHRTSTFLSVSRFVFSHFWETPLTDIESKGPYGIVALSPRRKAAKVLTLWRNKFSQAKPASSSASQISAASRGRLPKHGPRPEHGSSLITRANA